jgi:hypothetical protein
MVNKDPVISAMLSIVTESVKVASSVSMGVNELMTLGTILAFEKAVVTLATPPSEGVCARHMWAMDSAATSADNMLNTRGLPQNTLGICGVGASGSNITMTQLVALDMLAEVLLLLLPNMN